MINQYKTVGETTEIYLSRKDGTELSTFIDTADLELVNTITEEWYPAGEGNRTYILGKEKKVIDGKTKTMLINIHRTIMNAKKGYHVDHIDHDTLNNRRCNLRELTASENAQNRVKQSNNKSGVRGVSWNKRYGKWSVNIGMNKKVIKFGYFDDLKEAEKVAIEARKKYMPYSNEAV